MMQRLWNFGCGMKVRCIFEPELWAVYDIESFGCATLNVCNVKHTQVTLSNGT